MKTSITTRIAVLALAVSGLTGCGAIVKTHMYQADVHNNSDAPIEAQLVHKGLVNENIIAKRFIGPYDHGVVGPEKRPLVDTMVLIVQDPGNSGNAQRIPLNSGTTGVTVSRVGGNLNVDSVRQP